MEEQLNPLAVTHLLQHTLRSLCIHENSQWVYAVFWRILPRNYPPPKWDLQGGTYDRARGNRRNWILVWEDGFCNFAASNCGEQTNEGMQMKGLQPELFFKMSHEIYSYGEGLIGKVAADHSHKWVFKEPQDHEINFLSAWNNPADSQPRTWDAQFQSGIKTIALVAVREGVVQLGAINKVVEDLSFVVLLRKKFSYLESIPGVLLPHPSSTAFPIKMDGQEHNWPFHGAQAIAPPMEMYEHYSVSSQMRITPSMSSLEALLSKLPSVGGPGTGTGMGTSPSSSGGYYEGAMIMPGARPAQLELMGMERMVKEEMEEYGHEGPLEMGGESSSSMSPYYLNNVAKPSEGF
ncbi:putative transcription factor MYC/MYB [Dioscorea sansibarensis]